MSLSEFIQYFSWAIYLLIFIVVTAGVIRRPSRASIDIALLFGLAAAIIAISQAVSSRLIPPGPIVTGITSSLLLAMIYMLLRLVADFSELPRWVMPASEVALAVFVVSLFVVEQPLPVWLTSLILAYILGILVYSAVAFVREARQSSGVTARRLAAVAVGSIWLLVIFVLAGVNLIARGLAGPESELARAMAGAIAPVSGLAGLASAISYYIGFATPSVLRRAWQEPELRAFLGRAASLPRLPDTESIVRELEHGAATSLGAAGANVGLWDEAAGLLRFKVDDTSRDIVPTDKTISGRAFLTQSPVFAADISVDNPLFGETRRHYGRLSLISAPITAGEKRLGVVTVYAPRAPIFAEEDLALLQLLADQASVVLESRALIDEAARVQAREEAARLKEDFLSAAAHDLKTPLTTLVAQSELLERKAMRDPQAPTDLASLSKLKKEAYRLKTLVLELLDASRAEQGRLVGDRQTVDLAPLAEEVCARHNTDRHPCTVEEAGPAIGVYDPNRILQLLENLVENAVKYSPGGGPVRLKIWREEGYNHLTVTDSGIGIPQEDLSDVFERFHRGTNVDDRRFAGMGLGLFICKGIAEQHGGRIWVDSPPRAASNGASGPGGNDSRGTTFHVAIPAGTPAGPPTVAPVGGEGERQAEPVHR